MALGYGLCDRRFGYRQRLGIFLFTTVPRPALGPTQPPVHGVPGVRSLGLERQERSSNHLPPSGAEFKNRGAAPLLLQIHIHGVVLS
jgi:hypothetical protein